MANAATNRKPVSSLNATVSRLPKNPATKVSSFGREFHSRGRGALRFSLLVRVSVLKKKAKPRDCSDNDEISGGEISLCGLELDAEKPTLTFHEKEKKVVQLSDEEGPLGDSVSKDSSFKEVQVGKDSVEVYSSTWGLRNDKNGNNSRLTLLRRSPSLEKKHVLAKKPRFIQGDSISKGSSFKEAQVSKDSVEVYSTTWGLRNDKNGNNSRLSLLGLSPRLVKKQKKTTFRFQGDSVSKGSSFKEAQVGEDLVKEDSTTWGLRNDKNGNNSRLVLLPRSPRLVKKHVEVSHETFLPLTKEEEAEVRSAFSVRKRMKVLASHKNSNIVITGETLQCLKPCAWLNDEVINLYLDLLKERETREPHKYLKCHFCSTFFYTKLAGGSGYNYEAVRRWTTQSKLEYNLIDCDIIFVPIHGGLHWTLAVINIREWKFQYLDSLEGFDPMILKSLAKYLVDEVKDKSGKNIDVSLWDMEHVKDLPRQQNGYDCGMFMLKYIDFYSRGLKLCFSQKDMPYFRLRTAKEILRLRAH